jgi:hypothetical protein
VFTLLWAVLCVIRFRLNMPPDKSLDRSHRRRSSL